MQRLRRLVHSHAPTRRTCREAMQTCMRLLRSVTHLGSVPLMTNVLQSSRKAADNTSGTSQQPHCAHLTGERQSCESYSDGCDFLDLLPKCAKLAHIP